MLLPGWRQKACTWCVWQVGREVGAPPLHICSVWAGASRDVHQRAQLLSSGRTSCLPQSVTRKSRCANMSAWTS